MVLNYTLLHFVNGENLVVCCFLSWSFWPMTRMFVIMIIGQKNTTISVIYCRTTRGSRSLQSMFIAVLLSLKNWKRHQGWETFIVVIIHSQFHIVINYIIPVKRVIQDQLHSVIQTKRILIFTIIVFFSI